MPQQSPKGKAQQKDQKAKGQPPGLKNLATVGTELGLVVAVMTVGGWWLDGKLGSTPWLLLLGATIGIIGGLYKFWLISKRFFE
jgi:F0F1-type ATP synthase assembly protein I